MNETLTFVRMSMKDPVRRKRVCDGVRSCPSAELIACDTAVGSSSRPSSARTRSRWTRRLRHGRGFLLLYVVLDPGCIEEWSLEVAGRLAVAFILPLHSREEEARGFDTRAHVVAADRICRALSWFQSRRSDRPGEGCHFGTNQAAVGVARNDKHSIVCVSDGMGDVHETYRAGTRRRRRV